MRPSPIRWFHFNGFNMEWLRRAPTSDGKAGIPILMVLLIETGDCVFHPIEGLIQLGQAKDLKHPADIG